MKSLIIMLSILLTTHVHALTNWKHQYFAHEYSISPFTEGNITKTQFKNLLKKIKKTYTKTIHKRGGLFKIKAKWNSNRVNAYASRLGPIWKLTALGGLARHPMITYDGFAIVLCHEMGHHLGGAPKSKVYFKRWVSYEGQADYFATLKCFRTLFKDDNNIDFIKKTYKNIPQWATTKCDSAFSNPNQAALCIRSIMAGKVMANLIADYHGVDFPALDTPDPDIVEETDFRHPSAQCRLDTYAQGAICKVSDKIELNDQDPTIGACARSQGFQQGTRPLCWYYPEL